MTTAYFTLWLKNRKWVECFFFLQINYHQPLTIRSNWCENDLHSKQIKAPRVRWGWGVNKPDIWACKKQTKSALTCYKKAKIGKHFPFCMLKKYTGLKKVHHGWCWRSWLIPAMGAKTHPARTIKILNFGLQWLRLLASLRCRPTVCAGGASDGWVNWTHWQPWWEP